MDISLCTNGDRSDPDARHRPKSLPWTGASCHPSRYSAEKNGDGVVLGVGLVAIDGY